MQERENDIDPNQKSVIGKIVSTFDPNSEKSTEGKFNQLEQRKKTNFFFDVVSTISTGVFHFTPHEEDSISKYPIRYTVALSTGETVQVFNHYPYKVGDCMTVFTSKNPRKYPYRMVDYNGKC